MDISLKTEEYKVLKINNDNSADECVEGEFSLPEYMPEILRIIKTTAEPKIFSCKLIDGRITVDGVCEMRLIYTGEDGCIYCCTQQKQFTRHCENESIQNGIDVEVEPVVNYVNCRATGTKKAEFKTGITFKFKVFFENTYDYVNTEKCKGIEEKKNVLGAYSLGCKKTRSFSMSDSINLEVPAAFIVSQSACAILSEVRKINNKIMLRGETIVNISYVNSDNKALVERYVHSLPMNQILEVEGFEEKYKGSVVLKVTALDILPKGEQGNFNTSFDLSVGIDASVFMWEQKDVLVTCDAYGIENEVDVSQQLVPFCVDVEELNDTYIFDKSLEVSGEGVSSVLSENAEIKSVKANYINGELVISGDLNVFLVIKDTSGALSGFNKVFEFSYKKAKDSDDDTKCYPYLNLVSLKSSVKNSNTVDIRVEMRVCGVVIAEKSVNVLTDIKVSENAVKVQRMPITVYYPQKENEPLWDIARRYRTTVCAIAEENGLTGETTDNAKVLFIPSA